MMTTKLSFCSAIQERLLTAYEFLFQSNSSGLITKDKKKLHFIEMESHNMWSFVTGCFHLACFQSSSMLQCCQSLSFLIPCIYLNFSFFTFAITFLESNTFEFQVGISG